MSSIVRVILSIYLLLFCFQSTAQKCWSTSRDKGKGKELFELENGTFVTEDDEPYSGSVYSWYNENRLCAKGMVEDGLKEGKWESYFPGGAGVQSVTTFSKGIPKGSTVYYHTSGKVQGEINYDKKGLAQGEYTFKYEEGTIQEKGTFLNDELHGTVEEFKESGEPKAITDYKNGKKHGKRLSYHYSEGYLLLEENWKNDKKDGAFIEYFETGKPKTEEFYVDGKRDGESKQYFTSGELSSITTYKADAQEGPYISFNGDGDTSLYSLYEDGSKILERNFSLEGKVLTVSTFDEDGREHGKSIEYYKNIDGRIKSIRTYEHGKLKGEILEFYKSGNIKIRREFGNEGEWTHYKYYDLENEMIETETQMLDKVKHGVYKEYFRDGRVEIEGEYANGKQNGTWKKYNKDNIMYQLKSYKNGKKHGKFESYSFDGTLKETKTYKDGGQEGEHKTYFNTGKLESITNYENGKKNGEYILYDKSGEVIEQGQYKNDLREGTWKHKYQKHEYINGVKQPTKKTHIIME